MRYQDIISEIEDGVLRVTINRESQSNALSRATLVEIQSAFREAAQDESVNIGILTGAGNRNFCGGGDLKDLDKVRSPDDVSEMALTGRQALDAIRYFPVPVVAALNGHAVGGGSELAMACDFRIADSHVKIGFIQGRLNITPAWGGGADLIRAVGPVKALSLLATSKVLDVSSAEALGIIECYSNSSDQFQKDVEDFVQLLLRQKSQVLRALKALVITDRHRGRAQLDKMETEKFCETWLHNDHWAAAAVALTPEGKNTWHVQD